MRSTALWLVVLGACASPNTTGSTSEACQALTTAPAAPPAGWSGSVFTIVMENKSRGEIFGNKDAPYINRLAAQGAVANGYHDSYIHPSEANYLWMVAGENFDVLDDDDPSAHSLPSTSHIADQLEKAGLSWKSYQEGMGAPCGLVSHGRYAAKHDPFVFFSDINGWDGSQFQPSQRCIDHIVDYSQLDRDLAAGTVPKYAFITPNLDHDMHDGTIAEGDAWLANEVPKIMASDAYQHGGVIFVLWDEGGGTPAADDPPFLTLSPYAHAGMQSTTDFDTSSYLKTVEKITGVAQLPCDADVASVVTMDELYTMPMSQP
ncbi:MAG: alkaline phosphatase family protein [Kofleriaceae bacterium]